MLNCVIYDYMLTLILRVFLIVCNLNYVFAEMITSVN